jgi:hypothetical protein
MHINYIYNQFFVKRPLLATITLGLFVAGLVTLNMNSGVWAKADSNSDSKNTFGLSDSMKKGNDGDNGCDSIPQCKQAFDDAMEKVNNMPKPNLP